MKPLKEVEWDHMKRNLHENGWKEFFENYSLLVQRVNELTVALELDEREAIDDPAVN